MKRKIIHSQETIRWNWDRRHQGKDRAGSDELLHLTASTVRLTHLYSLILQSPNTQLCDQLYYDHLSHNINPWRTLSPPPNHRLPIWNHKLPMEAIILYICMCVNMHTWVIHTYLSESLKHSARLGRALQYTSHVIDNRQLFNPYKPLILPL